MTGPLTAEQLRALQELDACTLANSIEVFRERLRNEGFMNQTVRSLFPRRSSMLGYAATIQIRGSAPPAASEPYPDRTDWWDYILTLPAPRVLVIEDVATRPGLCSLIGEVHMSILLALDCTGVVTNGSVRDIPAAEAAGFHLFASGASVSHGYVHIVSVGQPVEVGGLTVNSGDLVHGDLHGVQTIPLAIAPEIPAAATRIRARERELIALCHAQDFSLEKLRAAVASQTD